ncbi:uncharacterized protein FMAN_05343 [Fusarium mangiferae]|uniref:Uncharacterized protein n=1 Tax=Fusarium mangiferae TaxID=192010 RepID=A0A1L7STL4_FUSMA|nr:uncharacterized protein FMAN_05343 [Fusarium mangiferae]CVK87812.1 uncharacterized protein FMAN_05343 [Fusarium mangiferae]
MATNAQLVPSAKLMVAPATPKPTLNQLMHVVHQSLARHTQACTASSWQATVSTTDRLTWIMNLIKSALLAMDEEDPLKVAEQSCNFEHETFHTSVSKEVYDHEMGQRIVRFFKRQDEKKPTLKSISDRYDQSVLSILPCPKRPEHLKELFPPRRRRVWHCEEPECELSTTKFKTKKSLQQHINEEHAKAREDPLESAQKNLGLAVGPELDGRESDTGLAENLVMPSSNASISPSVPCITAQDRPQGDKAHHSSLAVNPGKRNQPQQITTRGVRDGRILRPSATNKASRRDRQANLSSKRSGK